MFRNNHHAASIDAWAQRAVTGQTPAQQLQAFEEALGAVWQRAHLTLGDVTLTAIMDRVLITAAEHFPGLSSLQVDATTGLDFQGFRERTDGADHDQRIAGMRFVLVEFLTVLGNLTAEILTSSLHAELSKLADQGQRGG